MFNSRRKDLGCEKGITKNIREKRLKYQYDDIVRKPGGADSWARVHTFNFSSYSGARDRLQDLIDKKILAEGFAYHCLRKSWSAG